MSHGWAPGPGGDPTPSWLAIHPSHPNIKIMKLSKHRRLNGFKTFWTFELPWHFGLLGWGHMLLGSSCARNGNRHSFSWAEELYENYINYIEIPIRFQTHSTIKTAQIKRYLVFCTAPVWACLPVYPTFTPLPNTWGPGAPGLCHHLHRHLGQDGLRSIKGV